MRIGIVTTWFDRGAAYVSKQFRDVWCNNADTEVFIYARGGEKVERHSSMFSSENVTYGKRYSYTTLDKIDLKHFEKWITGNKLDIVFFNEQHIWHPVILCNRLGVTTGAYIDYYTKETVNLFGLYDFLICNTKRHLSVFNWHPQVYYVAWGTDKSIFNEKELKKTNFEEGIVFFHSAGMNPYRKGTDYVIKAFKNLDDDISKLVIHTQTNINKFFPRLKNDMDYLKSKGKLQIIEKTVSAPGLYKLGDVYVYPTRLEGIGLTIAEANACGLPVITTNEAPMNEFIIDGINGHLINVSNQEDRADGYYWKESYIEVDHLTQLMSFYKKNEFILDQMKKNSIEYSKINLDWKQNSIKLNKILNEIFFIKDKSDYEKMALSYERTRGMKYYLGNLTLYRKVKRLLK